MKIINPVLPLAFALIASASGKGEDELDGKRPRIIGGSDVEDNEFPTFSTFKPISEDDRTGKYKFLH